MNSGTPLSAEFKLLAECCRSGFAGIEAAAVAELAKDADWAKVAALSRRHRVQGLVWHGLRNLRGEIPAAASAILSRDASDVAAQNLQAAGLSKSLLEAFSVAGIPLLFVKGLTLSKLAYGDPFVKMGWDIDVLIPAETVERAAAELERLGFRQIIPASNESALLAKWHRRRKESVWRSPGGLHVELHSRLADNPDLIPAIGMASPRQPVDIAPGIALPTLALADLFAYLCVHGASSAWFRLKWITDLAALLHPLDPRQIGQLLDHAERAGAGRAADQALLLVSRIYGVSAPAQLMRKLMARRTSRWLADTAWNQLMDEREPTQVPLGTVPIHVTQLFLRPGIAFKIKEAARQLGDWVHPSR